MKRLIFISTFAALGIVATVSSSAEEVTTDPVAECTEGRVFSPGPDDWRSTSESAGPLAVRKHPLQTGVSEIPLGSNRFTTKLPVLVEGHEAVTLSVPPEMAGRVELNYDREYVRPEKSVTFMPCADQPRTIWGGGIRVKGREPVHLLVKVTGDAMEYVLSLGRPKAKGEGLAECRGAMVGSSTKYWRRTSLSAGPLGVRRHALQTSVMENRPGHFTTKMPVLIEGHDEVTLSPFPRVRERVLLGYGRSNKYAPSMTFRPCRDQPRTIWPGGIRVKGRVAVKFYVTVAGRGTRVLNLGRPKPMRDR